MSAFDQTTLRFYAREAPDYTSSGVDGTNRHLAGFLDRLTPGSSILELGCGAGRDAALMIERGFAVEPTDGVLEMAAQAAQRLQRSVRVMRFDELEAEAVYDAVYASYSLLHVPRPELVDILMRIWRALKPGGWHLASYKGGGTEGRDEFDRYFNYLARDQAEQFYRTAGTWALLEITEGEGSSYKGGSSTWVNVIARKPG